MIMELQVVYKPYLAFSNPNNDMKAAWSLSK